MILSQKKIEEIAVAVIRDFQKSFFGSEADDPARFALPTPIDQFASDYLNLKVSFQKLSSDGSIYGLTAYVDTEYQIEVDGSQRSIFLKTSPPPASTSVRYAAARQNYWKLLACWRLLTPANARTSLPLPLPVRHIRHQIAPRA